MVDRHIFPFNTLHSDICMMVLDRCDVRSLGRLERVNKRISSLVKKVLETKAIEWCWQTSDKLSAKNYIHNLFTLVRERCPDRLFSKKRSPDDKINHHYRKLSPTDLFKFLNTRQTYLDDFILRIVLKAGLPAITEPPKHCKVKMEAVREAIKRDIPLLGYFFKCGIDQNTLIGDQSLLRIALLSGAVCNVKFLLSRGAKDISKEYDGVFLERKDFLTIACLSDCLNPKMIDLLIDHANKNNMKIDFNQCLFFVASKGSIEGVQLFLDRGISIHCRDVSGNGLLHFAAGEYGIHGSLNLHENLTDYLLKKGVDHQIRNNDGNYPIHIAARMRADDVLLKLLGCTSNMINTPNINLGATPLAFACGYPRGTPNVNAIKILLQHGADPNPSLGMPPLHLASFWAPNLLEWLKKNKYKTATKLIKQAIQERNTQKP